MSINTYHTRVERLQKSLADLDKKRSQESAKIAKNRGEINRIERSITKSTGPSTVRMKRRQIETKLKAIAQAEGKLADYSKKIAEKTKEMNRTLKSLENAEARQQKTEETAKKKRHEQELRHAKAVTRETEKQARLHSQVSKNHLVIDLARLPLEVKAVIFAPNPIDQDLDRLRLDNEIREISLKVRASEYRDSVTVIPCLATQPLDVLQALNEHKPHIVHFSGHGGEDSIAFVDPDGNSKPVTKDAIVQVMQTTATNIRLVIFNTCLSSKQAEAVTQYVDAAIGMNDKIDDEAARVFAAQLYSAIGFGYSVKVAFEQAKTALMLEEIAEENIPELFVCAGIDADSIILVRPV